MRWIGASFFAAAFVTIYASEETQRSEALCDKGDESCVSSGARAMLQKKTRAEDSMDVMEEVETTVYEYAGAQISISADSDVALYGRGLWVITVDEGCTSADVEKMSEHMPAGAKANYSGHPDEGGLCVFMMEGTKEDVEKELETHTWPSPPKVTADQPIGLIPEINETDDDPGQSLLEESETSIPDVEKEFESHAWPSPPEVTADQPIGLIPEMNETDDDPGESSLSESETSRPQSWGLDRIDDNTGLDYNYNPNANYKNGGLGVHVYVLDTGIRITHSDFGGRAFSAFTVYPWMKECQRNDASCGADGQGHGTHCAGTIGGSAYGVAKKTSLYGVKVLSDQGGGSMSGIIKGIEYVMTKGHKPAVISMSLGGKGSVPALKSAVDSAVKKGIPVVVAAGNDGRTSRPYACQNTPAGIPSAITVGATDRPRGSRDRRASYSSYGKCLDLFAPGSDIKSAGHRSNTGTATMSGTSMACPHVAGVTALFLGEDKSMSPDAIVKKLQAEGVKNNIDDPRQGSPNVMLQLGGTPSQTPTKGAKTCGGNAQGAPCNFPFTYRGVQYSKCTTVGHTEPWCSTKGDKWGNCNCCVSNSPLYVNLHNAYRCKHCGTPKMNFDQSLEADSIAYAKTCPTRHASHRNGAGENLAYFGYTGNSPWTTQSAVRRALQSWYNEERNYNYATGRSKGGMIGHFTQMVWKGSTSVGCAVQDGCTNMWPGRFKNVVVVCRYKPAGNIRGRYTRYVGRRACSCR